MKRVLVSFLILLSAFLPSAGESESFPYPQIPSRLKGQSKQIIWFAKHFWDGTDKSSDIGDSVLEQAIVDYLTVLEEIPADKVKTPVRRFLRRVPAERAMPLVEKYLYDVESPMRDDDLYEYIVSKMSMTGGRELLQQISANKPGTQAPDFQMTDKTGRLFYLYDCLAGKHQTLLFFYDDSCDHCREVISDIRSSAGLAYLSALGVLRLVCVNISEDAIPVPFPAYCTDSRLSDEDFFAEGKYFFRSMPSFFLISPDGKIILKETTLIDALNHSAESQKIKL